jgi:hypothetical protein
VDATDWFGQQGDPTGAAPPTATPGPPPAPPAASPDPLAQLQSAPGYQFRLAEGAKALQRSAAARGTLLTGGTLKGLERYAQDYASGEYANRAQQLFSLAGLGQRSAAGQADANNAYATGAGNLITQAGNAQSAGTIAGGNAYANAINGGVNNALQLYYLSRLGSGGGSNYPTYAPGGPDFSGPINR